MTTKTITFLEMTSPDDLVPGKPSPVPLDLVQTTDPELVRRVHVGVGAPHGWTSSRYTDDEWAWELSRENVRRWIAHVDGEPAGILVVAADGTEHEIASFGLLPDFVGRGIGGDFLTRSVRLAWDGATRVHLDTTTNDHPSALPNYLARGFRPYRTMVR